MNRRAASQATRPHPVTCPYFQSSPNLARYFLSRSASFGFAFFRREAGSRRPWAAGTCHRFLQPDLSGVSFPRSGTFHFCGAFSEMLSINSRRQVATAEKLRQVGALQGLRLHMPARSDRVRSRDREQAASDPKLQSLPSLLHRLTIRACVLPCAGGSGGGEVR